MNTTTSKNTKENKLCKSVLGITFCARQDGPRAFVETWLCSSSTSKQTAAYTQSAHHNKHTRRTPCFHPAELRAGATERESSDNHNTAQQVTQKHYSSDNLEQTVSVLYVCAVLLVILGYDVDVKLVTGIWNSLCLNGRILKHRLIGIDFQHQMIC